MKHGTASRTKRPAGIRLDLPGKETKGMRRSCLSVLALVLIATAVGCVSGPGSNSPLTDLRGGSPSAPGHEIQPVVHKSPSAGESVALEADLPTEPAAATGWQRLLHPFQKSQRIPLPLSPKPANGDVMSEHTGF